MDLNLLWFILLGVLLIGYAILDGFDLGVKLTLPRLQPLTVQQAESGMLRRRRDGQVFRVERFDQPILQSRHDDFPSAELILELGAHFGRLEQCKAVAMRRVADHDVVALLAELIGQALNLINAVRFVSHRQDECERCAHRRQDGGQVNLGEVINKQVGGRGAAIHDNEAGVLQRGEDAVEFPAVVQIQKPGVRMKPFQRRVFIVGINRDVGDALVLEKLDEIDGEEAFADTAFAVEDEVETFHVL